MLVSNWKSVLARSATVWVSVIGAVLPEVPDLVLRWLADDSSATLLTPEQKNYIRMALMFFVIPIVRIIRQQSLSEPTSTPLPKD